MEPAQAYERAYAIDLSRAPWAVGREVCERLHAAGHAAVLVGGCVRDHLFGRPVQDVDVATDASPDQVLSCFPRCLEVGKQFGVVVVLGPGGQQIEVASFRSDEAYIDGRRPTGVQPASEAIDMQRRDFTINALVYDVAAACLRDHVGGLADLDARVLRVVGKPEDRLREDRLRVLRGLRFAAGLGLTIDPATWKALRDTSVGGLSRERIWDEWDKALAGSARADWWRLVCDAGHARVLHPALADLPRAEQDRRGEQLARLPAAASPLLGQALLLAGVAGLDAWLDDEPVSKERRRHLVFCTGRSDPQVSWDAADVVVRHRLVQAPEAEALLACWRAAWPEWPAAEMAATLQAERAQPFRAWLTAQDLLALGFVPGPSLGRCLRGLEEAQIRGEMADAEAARRWAAEFLKDQ